MMIMRSDGGVMSVDIADGAVASVDLSAELQAALTFVAPSGAVLPFDLAACPSGWSEFVPARGRAIIWVGPGGDGLSPCSCALQLTRESR